MPNVIYTISIRDLFTNKIKSAKSETDKLEKSVSGLNSTLKGIGAIAATVFTFTGVRNAISDIISVTRETEALKSALSSVFGGKAAGEAEFKYISEFSNSIGATIQGSVEGYKLLSAATRGTNLEGEKTRKIFEATSIAARVLHLNGDDLYGTFKAFSDIASKGTVQSEELKRQLGNRVPGAFAIAARAMGVTTAELNNLLKAGKLMSDDFLPAFANQLAKENIAGLADASSNLDANLNKLNNEIFMLKAEIGQGITPILKVLVEAMRDGVAILRDVWHWVYENRRGIKAFAGAVVFITGSIIAYNVATKTMAFLTAASGIAATIAGGGWAGLGAILTVVEGIQWRVNAAMAANPIGMIVLGIVALAGAFAIAYEKLDSFRMGIMTSWAVLKNLAFWIRDTLMGILGGLYEMFAGIFTADWDRAAMGYMKMVDTYRNAGYELGKAVRTGMKEGLGNFADDLAARQAEAAGIDVTKFGAQNAPIGGSTDMMMPGETLQDFVKRKNRVIGVGGDFTPTAPGGDDASKVRGQRIVNINIDINKMIEKFEINTTNMKESSAQIEEMVKRVMISAVNDSQIIAGK